MVLEIGLRGGAVREPFQVQVYTTPLTAEGKKPGCNKYNIKHYAIHND